MMSTLEMLVSLLTFPGVIVHQALRLFFCKRRRVAVTDMCFLRAGNPTGYITHEEAAEFNPAFSVCMGPLLVGSLLCAVTCWPAYWPLRVCEVWHPFTFFLLWLGISIGTHVFPSKEEANDFSRHIGEELVGLNLRVVLTLPLLPLVKLATRTSPVFVGFIYALVLGWGLPELIFVIVMKCVEPSA
jgi:hypothetical protein